MRLTKLDGNVVGKQLAKAFYTADGKPLLRAGVILTGEYVRSLRQKGFRSVYINDVYDKDIAIDDFIEESVRFRSAGKIKDIMGRYIGGESVEQQEIKSVVGDLLASLEGKENISAGLTALRSFDDYTYGHSVNVCLLAMVIGIDLYYDTRKLYELSIGALLHDIGKILIPLEILNKPAGLTPEEAKVVRKHTEEGFAILRKHFDLSLLSAHVPFEHHEWYNGSGYPRGLKREGIIEYARITTIADVFDAVTNDRIYRPRIALNQAYNLIAKQMDAQFDPRLARCFLERIQVFPNGTYVRLNTGEIGIIIRQAEKSNRKPTVRLLLDRTGERLSYPVEVDLVRKPELSIVEVLDAFQPEPAVECKPD
ncbi:MAG: HD-GYP domain-containing protein [bacterium]|jgi:HD-GYP domain-containing protein (c-di-GMP phosphodiesterase class II)